MKFHVSDVFRAKFSGRWGLRHTVFEEDVGAEVVRAFVSFLYTDKIKFKDTGDKDSVDDLLALLGMADKYNVPRLLGPCSKKSSNPGFCR